MIVTIHRIAGITFRTESNVYMPRLREEPYARFHVEDDGAADVCYRILKVAPDSLTLEPPTAEEQVRLAHGIQFAPGAWNSPLLRSPTVWIRLRESLDLPAQIETKVFQDLVVVQDFARRVVDFFYTEEYGPRGCREFDDGMAGSPIRYHMIPAGSLLSTPLTAEEQEYLVRTTDLTPREVSEVKVLRCSKVQALLRAGLERSDEMAVFECLGGVVMWDRSQNTIDFMFVREEEACNLADKRVVLNYPSLLSVFLPQFSAVMIHGAGVIRGDRAALFLAPDAGGKTTVLKLAPDGFLLSDDQVILRKEGEEFVAHATPLGLMTDGPGQAPIGALFILHQASHFEIEPIRPVNLMRAFWEDRGNYTRLLTKHLKRQAFDLFYEACHRVPTYRMSFPKDHVDWEAIDAAMA